MSLVAYTITALERDVADATASGKQVIVGATCSMYSQPSDTAVTLYDDATGSNGSTAKTTGANGQATVWVYEGVYRLSVNGVNSYVTVVNTEAGTTTQLIASISEYQSGDVINTSGFATKGDGGGGQWVKTAITGQTPSQSPAQLIGGLLNDANGDQWEYISRPVKVKALGAIPISTSATADSTAAIQAAFYIFQDPSLVNIEAVIASGDATREIYGNVIDLDGGQYLVSDNLDYSLCHGITIKNGTIIADSSAVWTAGDAILQNKDDFCINPNFDDIVIECNGVTNGVFMERCVYGVLKNVRVYGWFEQDFGIKAASNIAGFTTNIRFSGLKLWGTVAAETVDATTATGTGLVITDSDCEVEGGEISRALIGIDMSSAGNIRGVHLTGNGNDNSVGIELSGITQQKVVDCLFDNTVMVMNAREKTISSNAFFNSGGVESTQAITIKSTKVSDDLADCVIVGNRAKLGNGSRFITLDESAGDFLEIGQCKVTDNVCRDSNSLTAIPTQETQGIIIVDVSSSDFNGLAVEVNLSERLLLPDAQNAKFNGSVTASPASITGTPYCNGMLYDPATQTLTVLFSQEFTGQFGISYSWGSQDNNVSASTPSSPTLSNHHSFSGYLNSNQDNVTGNGTVYTIPFNAERYDNGSIFDTTTGQAVVKTGGVYSIDAQVMIDGLSGATSMLFTVEAGGRVFEDRRSGAFTGQRSMQISGGVILADGDTIVCKIQVSGNGSDDVTVNGDATYRTYVSAMLSP
jgi:hypothetical protein